MIKNSNDIFSITIALMTFVLILTAIYGVYRKVFSFLSMKAFRTKTPVDDYFLQLAKMPGLFLVYWILFKAFIHLFLGQLTFYKPLIHFNNILLIFLIAWISIQCIKLGAFILQSKLNMEDVDNLTARKNYTLIKIFKGIANTLIVLIAISLSLLTFEQAKVIGVSLLTSAGVLGLIIGFAAQKSLGMILAGIQLAITQPIRHDDIVIVEGEWGRIEEITLTYVVVKVWDERRLILPVTYFLEKPFQNWTRTSAEITGIIFLYVDYNFPVDAIRNILPEMLQNNKNWDKRLMNVQVTNATEKYKEVRILLSSSNAGKNWDLRTEIRERLLDFILKNYPEAFAKVRLVKDEPATVLTF